MGRLEGRVALVTGTGHRTCYGDALRPPFVSGQVLYVAGGPRD